jgi:hypothetical protein
MKNITFIRKEKRCKFCDSKISISDLCYLSNPFCSFCYEDRLIASGAVDLRDNNKIIDLGNGYVQVEAIDKTKLWKKSVKN